MNETYKRYRVYMQTNSGMFTQYDGYVDVTVLSDTDLFHAAVKQLRRTAFPDYSADMWKMVSYKELVDNNL